MLDRQKALSCWTNRVRYSSNQPHGFLAYTLTANCVAADEDMYDPNLIREETGLSKEELLSLVMAKSIVNAYMVSNEDANFTAII